MKKILILALVVMSANCFSCVTSTGGGTYTVDHSGSVTKGKHAQKTQTNKVK